MKKLLSAVTITAILGTGASAIDFDKIEIVGKVLSGAVVWIGDSQNTALTGGKMVFEANTVALGNMALGTTTSTSMDLSVRTNSISGVTMTISDSTNDGKLADGSKTKIPMTYKLDSLGDLTLGTAKSLVSAPNLGTSKIDKLTATANVPADQVAGDYKTTLTVTIKAN